VRHVAGVVDRSDRGPERETSALSLSMGTCCDRRRPELVEGLSAELFGENGCYSIRVVGGQHAHPKIAAEPDVVRFIHSPDMHLVPPLS
jgi:hypothetical protein